MSLSLERLGPGERGGGDTHRKGRSRATVAGPVEAPAFADQPDPPRPGSASSEIAILDGDGTIVVVNQAWRASIGALGFELPDAGIGMSYADVACRSVPDLDRAGVELSLRRVLSGAADELRRTYAIPTPHGRRWRSVQITPLSVGAAGRFVAIHDDLTELVTAQAALKSTSEQLLAARDEERQRIAIELHDSTSQHLAAINLGLERLRRAAPHDARETGIIDDIATALREAVKETRVLSYLMKPRGLAPGGLVGTLRQFLEGFAQRTGLQVTLEADAAVDRAPARLQHAALRIIQEALLNANRHAQAQRVSVEVAVNDTQLTVSIADDGRGMAAGPGGPNLGVGIPGMQARAQQLSGELEIASDARGTRVVAWLPLPR